MMEYLIFEPEDDPEFYEEAADAAWSNATHRLTQYYDPTQSRPDDAL